ncbi:MAG: metallophosphoesterase family protein [Candidatus Woesearchaeota archaeon]|nr:MAG: metallophosphoesterase family protein [Candidatus Woesearchaeota archaeon]
METLRLGIIACIHGNIKALRRILKKFKKENIDALILAGDIPKDESQLNSIKNVIKTALSLKKPIYAIPGSHESFDAYTKALKIYKKNKLIYDCTLTKNRTVKIKSHKLIFLPGSDSSSKGAGYRLVKDKKQAKEFVKYAKSFKEHFFGKTKTFIIKELSNLIKPKDNPTVICHVPPKFNKKQAIDVATFGKPTKDFIILRKHKNLDKTTGGELITKDNTVFPIETAKKYIKAGYPVEILSKNVGNEYLKKTLKQLKVKKFICGHIHEAGHKATNFKGNPIKQNAWSKELYYNCAAGTEGRTGIYIIKGSLAKYKNIKA